MPESPNKLLNNDHGNYVYATYTGHIFDTTLDIYYAEARFYDAETRTWMSVDQIKDGNNWYQYCYSSPVVYYDYDGESPILIGVALGAVSSFAVSLGTEMWDGDSFSLSNVNWKNVAVDTAIGAGTGAFSGVLNAGGKLATLVGKIPLSTKTVSVVVDSVASMVGSAAKSMVNKDEIDIGDIGKGILYAELLSKCTISND